MPAHIIQMEMMKEDDEAELMENVDFLIDYFIGEEISPKKASLIVLRLLAEHMVAANQDHEILQQALNETVVFLSTEISLVYRRFMLVKQAEAEAEAIEEIKSREGKLDG